MNAQLVEYRNWRPCQVDCRGLGAPDRQSWLVGAFHSRDSRLLEESNWAVVLKELGGESDTVEVHRFNHWACGWLEIVLAAPSREADLQALADRLESYPILDESDYSDREYTATIENITDAGRRFLADGAPDNWAAEVYDWLAMDGGYDMELESRDDQGGYPDDESLQAALGALGWLDAD